MFDAALFQASATMQMRALPSWDTTQHIMVVMGWDSSVSIATGYGLDSPGIESR
jgi:hypothetical protein